MFVWYYFHPGSDILHSSRLPRFLCTLPESIFSFKVFLVWWFCCFWGSRVCFCAVLVALQWVFGKVSSRSILFDPSLVPHWGTGPWFICATTDAAWILTFSFHSCLLHYFFRFPPSSIFILTSSLGRLPIKTEDPYPAMRRLVIPRQMLT